MAEAHVGPLPDGMRHCRICAEPINKAAQKCIRMSMATPSSSLYYITKSEFAPARSGQEGPKNERSGQKYLKVGAANLPS